MQLFHHPFCPHSRFVRLALGEYAITAELIEERTWERRPDLLAKVKLSADQAALLEEYKAERNETQELIK